MNQGNPTVWNCFNLEYLLVDKKRSNAVRPDSSRQFLATAIDFFLACGHNSVVMTFIQKIIAFTSMMCGWYVTVFIMRSEILLWWCASTPLTEMVWFAEMMIALKTQVLKSPLSAWCFWIFTPNVDAYFPKVWFAC